MSDDFEITIAKVKHARASFRYFTQEVFSRSSDIMKNGEWTGGDYIDDICNWLQDNPTTIRVSARDHFKSMSLYAYIMWLFFRNPHKSIEVQYFSYNGKMASYHVGKIKTAILCNPYFAQVIDKKQQADSVIAFSFDGKSSFDVTPRGLMEFKRGVHAPYIFVDDPMQDPENKLVPTKIIRINDIMTTQILDMYQNELHIAGTAQTNGDFYFDPDFTTRFSVRILPAEKDAKTKTVLWKEWIDWDGLMMKKKERGEKIYNQEYLCSPVYSEEAYVNPEQYDLCVNQSLPNWDMNKYVKDDSDVVGGLDIGKKAHPSHLAIFKKTGDKWIQLHSKWFDQWDYTDQVQYLQQAIEKFGMYIVPYDATRGEFEALDEQGELPAEMEPFVFTFKKKHSLATNMDKAILNKEVEFLPEARQRSQILCVNNDLQAPETKEGHGDAFWSVCLALSEYEGGNVEVSLI